MNCSEQILVAQRRTAALLLHARCPDVAPKDLPSARFATLEPQKRFMRMSPGNLRTEPGAKCGVGQLVISAVPAHPVQMARPGPSPITVPSFGAGRGEYSIRKRCGYGATLLGADRGELMLEIQALHDGAK